MSIGSGYWLYVVVHNKPPCSPLSDPFVPLYPITHFRIASQPNYHCNFIMKLSPEKVHELQHNTEQIRNICILAHVDHGKTSLSDSLLATNGIISQRMAGKVRYLDSREDEQLRGITMESSAISLYFKVMRQSKDGSEGGIKEYLINLIDSPGHIDFSSEVSTASRLCDGAVVLVDVVEGVCSQTVNVLRQCWTDKLKPILVLNKIDRLVTEWKLSPMEAYQHLSRTIEQVNSVIGTFFAGERMEDDMIWRESGSTGEFVEKDDKDIYFAPESNNVIFASAVDGWAFSINTFAKIYLAKLGFSHAALSKTLWGDFYLDMKNKKVIPGSKLKSNQSLKPLFVSLIMEQIWTLYQYTVLERDQERLEKIIEKLGAKIGPRDLRSKDVKQLLNLIMSQWIPVSHALLGTVIDYLPSPIEAQQQRMHKILTECLFDVIPESSKSEVLNDRDEKSIVTCDKTSQNVLAYVSKMVSVPNEELPKDNEPGVTEEEFIRRGKEARELARKASEAAAALKESEKEDEVTVVKKDPFEWEFEEEDFEQESDDDDNTPSNETLIAFTRVFAGLLSVGQTVVVIGPKYDPSIPKDHLQNQEQIKEVVIQDLYLIMGRLFLKVDEVPAGNIVGVVGLDDAVLKNATLSSATSNPYINLASTKTLIHNEPILKIAIEPTNPSKLSKLERGLDLLSKADPVFEWYIDDETGELIMCVAGELHLERCLKDLEERFAKGCDVSVKEPVIPFREGLISNKAESSYKKMPENYSVEGLDLEIEVQKLPVEITNFLIAHEEEFSRIVFGKGEVKARALTNVKKSFREVTETVEESPREIFEACGVRDWEEFLGQIVSLGPRRYGPNLLVETTSNNSQFGKLLGESSSISSRFDYENNVINGFELAMKNGPLASEPMQGVLVVLRKSQFTVDEDSIGVNISGRIYRVTRDLIHTHYLSKSPRLFLAMYTCDIQASGEVLGRVYAVVQKRGGSIISEEMKEGSPFFAIEARIPVVEAFGFSEEIRKKTSGAASPQLVFDGYDILDTDPFWVPHTTEELEELGEFAERENVARRYMNTIRRRKGLFVDEKTVKNAEKQRTLKKD